MEIKNCSKEDFDEIISEIEDFWGSKRTLHIHYPALIYEFGNTAFVIKIGGKTAAYLFGFFSQVEPVAYVHLLAVRKEFQKNGYGSLLYNLFIEKAKENKCKYVKAITSLGNSASISFHKKIGMELTGDSEMDGIKYVKNYSGPGQDRVVFKKSILY